MRKKILNNNQGNTVMLVVVLVAILLVAVWFGYQYYHGQGFNNNSNIQPIAQAQEKATVRIDNNGFSPATVTIKSGGRVVWQNNDSVVHALTGDPSFVNIEPIEKNTSISVSFDKVGTINYYDANNPNLRGQIIVQ